MSRPSLFVRTRYRRLKRLRAQRSEHIFDRLAEALANEPEVSFRDDLKIAQLIVLHCERGDAIECSPEVLGWYEVLGCHPEQVWPRIVAQRQAMLGNLVNFQAFKFARKMRNQEAQRENVESESSVRGPKTSTGNLYAMPLPPRPAKQKPLRILPVEDAG